MRSRRHAARFHISNDPGSERGRPLPGASERTGKVTSILFINSPLNSQRDSPRNSRRNLRRNLHTEIQVSFPFGNLADGSTLVVGTNTYKANYEGGAGQDLTLTVL